MFYARILAGIAVAGLVTGAALAQSAWVEVDDDVHVAAFGATADQVDDWDVYNDAGVEIGEVEEVIGTARDLPAALVVDLDGTHGYPDRDVIIPIDQFTRADNRLTLDAGPDAVEGMERWDD